MIRRLREDETGIGLMELLIAIACSTIVLFGLSTILINTTRQTAQTFTRVDATRQGRTAIANIENELHSACTGAAEAPIQAGSTANSLAFVSYYGAAAAPTPVWHVITYNPTAKTLTDASYAVTGSAPTFTQGALISTNLLLSNVTQQGSTPIFQYFAYSAGSTDAASGGTYWYVQDGINADPGTGVVGAAAPLADSTTSTPSGLSAANALNTVEVLITYSAGATSEGINNLSLSGINDQVSDAVSLRLTTPPNEVSASVTPAGGAVPSGYGPCQ